MSAASAVAPGETDPHCFALLSDTHVARQREAVHRGTNMFQNMQTVSKEVLSLPKPPAAVLVSGDCAFLSGLSSDYEIFLEAIAPYRAAGLHLHCMLGNHDNRENFWAADGKLRSSASGLDNRQVSVLKADRANFFLLDSLEKTNSTPGLLGEDQIRWLATALDAHADRPAVIIAHHHLIEGGSMASGLKDTQSLLEVLVPRKHVKAYVFGHTHHWHHREHEGIHLVNLPPVAYPFNSIDPSGWVRLDLKNDGASFQLSTVDPRHKQHGERFEVAWRS
jgi:3',5'-cyclic AMP phosphodiesterase CpdA